MFKPILKFPAPRDPLICFPASQDMPIRQHHGEERQGAGTYEICLCAFNGQFLLARKISLPLSSSIFYTSDPILRTPESVIIKRTVKEKGQNFRIQCC